MVVVSLGSKEPLQNIMMFYKVSIPKIEGSILLGLGDSTVAGITSALVHGEMIKTY